MCVTIVKGTCHVTCVIYELTQSMFWQYVCSISASCDRLLDTLTDYSLHGVSKEVFIALCGFANIKHSSHHISLYQ